MTTTILPGATRSLDRPGCGPRPRRATRPWRGRSVPAAILLTVALAGCSTARHAAAPDEPPTVAAEAPGPVAAADAPVSVGAAATEVTIAPDARAGDAGGAASEDRTPLTLPQTARVGLGPAGQEPRNVLGIPVRLDETASLACAHAQFAEEALGEADVALAGLEIAAVARWGAPSANAEISGAATHLAGVAAEAARSGVDSFLAMCRANGHL